MKRLSKKESGQVMTDFSCMLIRLKMKAKDGYKILVMGQGLFHAIKSGRGVMNELHNSLARSLLEHEKKGNEKFIKDELERKKK